MMKIRILWLNLFLSATSILTTGFSSLAGDREKLPVELSIERILGARSSDFVCQLLEYNGENEFFELETRGGKVVLRGNSQPAIGYALNYYLTNYCKCQYSRAGINLNLPENLPEIPSVIHLETPYPYRYLYNYCTFNYSKSFWGWEEWERELDWLVLHGINMPLAILGTEAVWQNTLRHFNVPGEAIERFIPGPAYTAWWLMGNIEGWGGPVSQQWINQQSTLQKKVVTRMRELGMTPVFQGFYGMVPDTLRTLFPSARISYGGMWAGDREGFRRPAFLDPSDPLFAEMASVYYAELHRLYGKTGFYGGDPFHEGGNTENIDITKSASLIQQSMLNANPEAIWALQGWWDNPTDALLAGVNKDHTLILDLYAEGNPQWERREGFGGIPWVWCSLLNFGGKVGMYSRLGKLAAEPARALASEYGSKMKGIGMMMEGDQTNPVNFELVFDAVWSKQAIDLDQWIPGFVASRYGSATKPAVEAWNILRQTALNCPRAQEGTSESIFCARGDIGVNKAWRWGFIHRYYAPEKLQEALRLLLSCESEFRTLDTYQYDVTDLCRQAISNHAYDVYGEMMAAFKEGNAPDFNKKSQKFLQLMDDQDRLLSTRKEFLLGAWLESSKKNATNDAERTLFEQNARTLITVWGNEGVSKELHEYANREWAGMVGGLYKSRWRAFIEVMKERLQGIESPLPDYYAMEADWIRKTDIYPGQPGGDPVAVANELYNKYFKSE